MICVTVFLVSSGARPLVLYTFSMSSCFVIAPPFFSDEKVSGKLARAIGGVKVWRSTARNQNDRNHGQHHDCRGDDGDHSLCNAPAPCNFQLDALALERPLVEKACSLGRILD